MVPLDLANIVGGNPILNIILMVLNVSGLLGLVLLSTLLMDKLDAEHGSWGFCSGLAGVGLCGVMGGYVGWRLHSPSGAYFGSLAGIAVGMGIVFLALRFFEYKARLK